MPQMMPIYWMLIMLFILTIYSMMLTALYFFTPTPFSNKYSSNLYKLTPLKFNLKF